MITFEKALLKSSDLFDEQLTVSSNEDNFVDKFKKMYSLFMGRLNMNSRKNNDELNKKWERSVFELIRCTEEFSDILSEDDFEIIYQHEYDN